MYPCRECLVKPICSEICDKVYARSRLGTTEHLIKNICPDCGTNNKFNVRQAFSEYIIDCIG
jgi:hypothetical protein